MNSIPPPQPPIWDHGQRRMALVQSVLSEVLNGHWKPGQHLVGQELADRYGVSQTPVREALITLAGIGVVELLPNRGAVVRQVTIQEVKEVCQVRRILECEAVRSACGRIGSELLNAAIDEARSLAALEPSAELMARARTADDALHDLIAHHCGSSLLAREIGRLKLLFRAYRDTAWERVAAVNDFSRIPQEAAEHLAILDALAARSRTGSSKAMAAHIKSGERYWIKLMAPKQKKAKS